MAREKRIENQKRLELGISKEAYGHLEKKWLHTKIKNSLITKGEFLSYAIMKIDDNLIETILKELRD